MQSSDSRLAVLYHDNQVWANREWFKWGNISQMVYAESQVVKVMTENERSMHFTCEIKIPDQWWKTAGWSFSLDKNFVRQ